MKLMALREAQLYIYTNSGSNKVRVEIYDKPLRNGNLGFTSRYNTNIKTLKKFLTKFKQRREVYINSFLDNTMASDPRIDKLKW